MQLPLRSLSQGAALSATPAFKSTFAIEVP
jgi:hypothetical protein